MTDYAIGDIQGCYNTLSRLLDRIQFDPGADRIFICGDLVNRGGQSLEVLRLIHSLEKSAPVVLGNHDLGYLAQWSRKPDERRRNAEMESIFAADDGEELMTWLHAQPFLRVTDGFCMVHAGLYPGWSIKQARKEHQRLIDLRSETAPRAFYRRISGQRPRRWRPDLGRWDRARVVTNIFTRMRFVDASGRLDFDFKASPKEAPKSLTPWFKKIDTTHTVVFGHWSALGLKSTPGVLALDTGCVWGGALTAVALTEERTVYQEPCGD